MLKARGLQRVSAGTFGYDSAEARTSTPPFANAKALGVKVRGLPVAPRRQKTGVHAERSPTRIAAEFNALGRRVQGRGIALRLSSPRLRILPTAAGNGESAVRRSWRGRPRPDLVCYEMDVFWAFHAGQDPVAAARRISRPLGD
jgi:sugar phosphate isomerase/epimerase